MTAPTASLAPPVPLSPVQSLPDQPNTEQVSPEEFSSNYCKGMKFVEDEETYKNKEPIYTLNMDDCITLFSYEPEGEYPLRIGGFHIKSYTKSSEIISRFLDGLEPNVELYIIGGNAKSTSQGDLLDEIYKAIESHFGNRNNIKVELIYPKKNTSYKWVSGHLGLDGKLTYCMTKNLF